MKKYELIQGGKKYILSSKIFEDKLRFACIDYSSGKEMVYIGEYIISDLIQINSIFSNLTEISKAQELFDKLITKQKVSIETKDNYLNLNIIIKKENQPVERFTIKLTLFNKPGNIINIHSKNETSTNKYNLNYQGNNANENLFSLPIINNNESIKENYIQKKTEHITTSEENISSQLINTGKNDQLINSESNIMIKSKEELNLPSDMKEELPMTNNYQAQNNNFNFQEEHNIIYNQYNEVSSEEDFIQKYMKSTENMSSQVN